MLYSPFHIEITPSDYEFDDRYIVQNVVKEIAAEKGSSKNDKLFKILIINEADKLSREAQGALRRTMEKYMSRCRMILVCDTVHQLIMPIRSRCLNIRVPAPSNFELAGILTQVAHEQKLGVNEGTIDRIIESSRGNVRDAICQLECYRYSKKPETIFHPYKP
jgi:replication factor C subunit 3/5